LLLICNILLSLDKKKNWPAFLIMN